MILKILPVLIIGLSAATYHLGSKNLGKIGGDKPWIVLAAVYLVATILSVVFGFLAGDGLTLSRAEIKTALPFLLLLAIACVGIEGGYLWAYRSGWKVTEFMPLTSLTSGVLVLGVGCLAFQEGLSLWSGAGLALVVSGTAVMHWR